MTHSLAPVAPTAAPPEPGRPARRPLATPIAVPIATVMALIAGAAGVVCGRDALIGWKLIGGRSWTAPMLDAVLDVRADSAGLAPGAIAVLIVGLALVIMGLAPRRRTHYPLTADGVWLRRRDVDTLIVNAGNLVAGVDAVHVRGSGRRRSVTVTPNVSAAADLPGLSSHVNAAFETATASLAHPPKITVHVQKSSRR